MPQSKRSRAQYEKEYRAYVAKVRKAKGQKGAEAARAAMEEVGQDYVLPAAKGAASLAGPVGIAIGLLDAAHAWQRGERGSALAMAGLEAVPAVLGGGFKLAKKVLTPENIKHARALMEIADVNVGRKIEETLGNVPNINKIVDKANTDLAKGLGIKKVDSPLRLSNPRQVFGEGAPTRVDVNIGGETTGDISLGMVKEPRKATEILKGKPQSYADPVFEGMDQGITNRMNYPFAKDPLFEEMYKGKGVSSEIMQSINKNTDFPITSGGTEFTNDSYRFWDSATKKGLATKVNQPDDIMDQVFKMSKNNKEVQSNIPTAALGASQLKNEFKKGGNLLQPTSPKLPMGYKIPNRAPSSELAMSIGGEGGESAYLIPSFKHGKPLNNPIEEYRKTNEILGGPFKTWQDADKWEREVRHPYVEKGQNLPSPLKWWNTNKFADGGSLKKKTPIPDMGTKFDFAYENNKLYYSVKGKNEWNESTNPEMTANINKIVMDRYGHLLKKEAPVAQPTKKVTKEVKPAAPAKKYSPKEVEGNPFNIDSAFAKQFYQENKMDKDYMFVVDKPSGKLYQMNINDNKLTELGNVGLGRNVGDRDVSKGRASGLGSNMTHAGWAKINREAPFNTRNASYGDEFNGFSTLVDGQWKEIPTGIHGTTHEDCGRVSGGCTRLPAEVEKNTMDLMDKNTLFYYTSDKNNQDMKKSNKYADGGKIKYPKGMSKKDRMLFDQTLGYNKYRKEQGQDTIPHNQIPTYNKYKQARGMDHLFSVDPNELKYFMNSSKQKADYTSDYLNSPSDTLRVNNRLLGNKTFVKPQNEFDIGGAIQTGSNMIQPLLPKDPYGGQSTGSALLGGAAKGASTMAFAGPWAMAGGALVGGIAGMIGNKKEDEAMRLERDKRRASFTNAFSLGGKLNKQVDYLGGAWNSYNMARTNGDINFLNTMGKGGKITDTQIKHGMAEEMEHTSSKKEARKITMDHLNERADYYKKLKSAGLAEAYANGGELHEYNNGGTHESNPLGGIPMGYDEEGTPNMVEQGETRYEDFVFSDRLKMKNPTNYGLNKSLHNKTFADASKRLAKESEERPYDQISKRGKDAAMQKLMGANQEALEVAEMKEANSFANGGKIPYDFNQGIGDYIEQRGTPQLHLGQWNQPGSTLEGTNQVHGDIMNAGYTPAGFRGTESTNFNERANFENTRPNYEALYNQEPAGKKRNIFSEDNVNDAMRYAPVAFNAIAGLTMRKPDEVNFNKTAASGLKAKYKYTPKYVDETRGLASINSANRGTMIGLTNASGGNAASVRANLQGTAPGYLKAREQLYTGLTGTNLDQYTRAESQAAQLGLQGQQMDDRMRIAEEEINAQNMGAYTTNKYGMLGAAATGVGQIGTERYFGEMTPRISQGYDQRGRYNKRCFGGNIRRTKK